MTASRLVPALMLLALGLFAAACDTGHPDWSDGLHDLTNVPLSPGLRPALTASVATLDQPDSDAQSVRDYATYCRLMMELRPMNTRGAAADEIYRRWREEPQGYLWVKLARAYDHLLKRSDELARMLATPALNDTTTGLGAYMAGRLSWRRAERERWYHKAERLQDQLTPMVRQHLVLSLASVDRDQGQALASIERLLVELPAARRTGGHSLESEFWSEIATRLAGADRLDDALYAATLAAAHARSGQNPYFQLQAQVDIATIISQRGEYTSAIEGLAQLADEAEKLNFPWVTVKSLDKAAQISCDMGDYERALEIDRRILHITRQIDDVMNVPRSLASIAHDFRMTGQLDSTYIYLSRAQAIVDTAGVVANRAKMAELMAGYYCQIGDYAQAGSLMTAATSSDAASKSRWNEAVLLLELLPSALEMGRPDLAYEWLDRIAASTNIFARREYEANYLADFETLSARLLADQGETRLASEALARARAVVEDIGGEDRRWQLEAQTGELALQRGDPRRAEQAFMTCLDLALQGQDPRKVDRSRFQLGQMYLDQGDLANAEAMFAALDKDETFGHAYRTGLTSQLLLGMTRERQGRPGEALRMYDEALSHLTVNSPADLVLRFRLGRGRTLSTLGQHRAAATELWDVLASLADNPHLVSFADLPVFHSDLERTTREVLLHNLVSGSLVPASDVGRATLEIAFPGLAGRIGQGKPSGPALIYFLGDDRSWTWLVTKDRIEVRSLPPAGELLPLLTPILVDLGQPGRPVDERRLTALANVLLGALDDHWPRGSTLTLVPDRGLQLVPWAALPLADDLVLDRGPIREIEPTVTPPPSLSIKRPDNLNLLAIGCNRPTDPGQSDLPTLRQAEAEAEQVASHWSGPSSKLATGADANWARLLAGGLEDFGVIHLASHAEIHQGVGSRSTLRLAGRTDSGQSDSTPVTMVAIRRLNLSADLVFLSSCRSGLPTGSATRGTRDFAAAFLAAGAKTVIASTQWVDDDAARLLAQRFYNYWQAGADKATALQFARRDVRSEWPDPAYWGFLRLVGEP